MIKMAFGGMPFGVSSGSRSDRSRRPRWAKGLCELNSSVIILLLMLERCDAVN